MWALLAMMQGTAVEALVPVPRMEKRVTDQVGLLDAGQQASLENKLQEFEKRKGTQVAVLIVPTTQPEAIEAYSIRVAEEWKMGRRGVDDGVLLLIASGDRALRIEVGYGLEGVMPDAICKRIIDEIIVPRLRSGDFAGGISDGVARILRVIDGEPLPPPRKSENTASSDAWRIFFIIFLPLFILFLRFYSGGGYSHHRRGWWVSGGNGRWGGGWNGGSGGGFGGGGGGFGGGGASGRW